MKMKMRNVEAHLLEDKMDEAVTHYINSHQSNEPVHIDTNGIPMTVQDDGAGRVTVMHQQTYTTQMCRQVSVTEQVGDGPWGEELLEGPIAAIVAHLQNSRHHPPPLHKVAQVRTDVDTSVILDGSMRFNGQTLEQQSEPIVVQLPPMQTLPPLQDMKRCAETDWFSNKNKKDTPSMLQGSDSPVLDLGARASPAQHKQQNRKSLPHKKRISRKLKRNNGNCTPQQELVVINCSESVTVPAEQEQILPDNFVTVPQHAHHMSHEVRPMFICQICGDYYGEEQLKFYHHLKQHYDPHATIIIENPVPDLAMDKITNNCIVDNVATLPDSIVELTLENTVPKTMYQPIDKHILYTSSDKTLTYNSNKLQYSMASMDKEPAVPTSEAEKSDLYETLDKLELYNCGKCSKTFRKQKQCEAHMREAHSSNTKLEDMGEFSEPEDLMAGIQVCVGEGEPYEQTLLPHLTVENGQVHQEHTRHWYSRGGGGCGSGGGYCAVCARESEAPPLKVLKEEVLQRIFDSEVSDNANFADNMMRDHDVGDHDHVHHNQHAHDHGHRHEETHEHNEHRHEHNQHNLGHSEHRHNEHSQGHNEHSHGHNEHSHGHNEHSHGHNEHSQGLNEHNDQIHGHNEQNHGHTEHSHRHNEHDHEHNEHSHRHNDHGQGHNEHIHGLNEHSHGNSEHGHGHNEHSHGHNEHSHGHNEHSHGLSELGQESHGHNEHSHGLSELGQEHNEHSQKHVHPLKLEAVQQEEPSDMKAVKSFECQECDRVFTHRNSLLYHVLSHAGKQHVCRECGKGFYTHGALKIHKRVHNGDRPYKCEECGREFRQWSDLKYHKISLHSDKKHFKCEFCGKEFARKYSLNVHVRIHTGEKNYKCDFCSKTFRAATYRTTHMRTHTGDRPFKCEECEKSFRSAFDLRRHMLVHDKVRNRFDELKTKLKDQKKTKTGDIKEEKPEPHADPIAVPPTARPAILKKNQKSKKSPKKSAPNVTVQNKVEQFKVNDGYTDSVEVYDNREYNKIKNVYSESDVPFKSQIVYEDEQIQQRQLAILKPIFRGSNLDSSETEKVNYRAENTDGKMQVYTHIEKGKDYNGSIVSNAQVLGDIRHLERDVSIPREVRSEIGGEVIETAFLERLTAMYNVPAV